MSALLTGFILLFVASISQGTMGYGQKRFKPMSWEAYWFLFCILSMVAVPIIWINVVIPDPIAALNNVSDQNILIAASMGALWGIGALMWAKALVYLGLSMTYGIGMSMSAMIGSLGVLLQGENIWDKASTYWIMAGIGVVILGILIITLAGVKREKIKGQLPDVSSLSKGMLILMFIFAFANGIFSSGLPLGFDRVEAASNAAIEQGAAPYNASLLNWVYVFIGGLIVQAGYAFVVMIRKKTFNSFTTKGSWKAYLTASITAVLWFAPLALFGMSTAVLGDLGKIIGWPIYCALAVIASNILAYFTGEWKGAIKPFKQMLIGVVVLIISLAIFGYANTME